MLFAIPSTAQQEAGTFEGQVVTVAPDGEQLFVAGADVALIAVEENGAGGEKVLATAVADGEGRFLFEEVPFGCYRIRARSAGLEGFSEFQCLSATNAAATVAVALELTAVQEEIDVTARRGGLEPRQVTTTESVGSDTLQHAPIANERFREALPLIPGVVRGPDGLINMKGARSTQSGSLVNSANVTDPVTGQSAINLPLDVVSNVEVLANPFDAEYGKFAGAVSSVNTDVASFKKFRYQIQNIAPRLRFRDYQIQNIAPRLRFRDGELLGIDSFIPRVTVSGPLIRDRLTITQSLEYRFVRTEIEEARLPQLERETQLESLDAFTRADMRVNEQHSFAVTLSFYPQKQNFFGLDTFTTQEATPNLRQRGYLLVGQDDYTFSSGALLESLVSFKVLDNDVRANSNQPFEAALNTAQGGFFNLQQRDTHRIEAAQTYHFQVLDRLGRHQTKLGYRFTRNTYRGDQIFHPVSLLGAQDQLVQRIEFGPPALGLDVDQNEYTFFVQNKWNISSRLTFFVQNKWNISSRLTLDLGLRFDRDSIADESNFAPRGGFAYLLTNDGRTVFRAGAGVFYDRVTLNVPTFLDLPARTETRFGPSGGIEEVRPYRHRLLSDFENPRSVAWNVQLDREALPGVFVRVSFQQRTTTQNFLVNPARTAEGDFLDLTNGGRDRYQEFQLTTRWRIGEQSHLTASYVYSDARGDLNTFNEFFGGVGAPLIRPNENGPLPFDTPHRFLFWADIRGPYGLIISPIWDIHTGFPYSMRDEQRDFVGPRNEAGRFPAFTNADLQVLKRVTIPVLNKKAFVGFKVTNVFNTFNPVF